MPTDDVFPALVCCTNLQGMKDAEQSLFDVQFYPYSTVDGDQIFAVAGERDVYVCRMVRDAERPFEILRWFEDGDVSHASVSRSCHRLTISGNRIDQQCRLDKRSDNREAALVRRW